MESAEPSHQKKSTSQLSAWGRCQHVHIQYGTQQVHCHGDPCTSSKWQQFPNRYSEPLATWFTPVFGEGSGIWCHSWPWQTHIVGDHFPWLQRVARMTYSEKKIGTWRPACQPHVTRHGRPCNLGKRSLRTQETVGPKADNDPLSDQPMKKMPMVLPILEYSADTVWPLVGIRAPIWTKMATD